LLCFYYFPRSHYIHAVQFPFFFGLLVIGLWGCWQDSSFFFFCIPFIALLASDMLLVLPRLLFPFSILSVVKLFHMSRPNCAFCPAAFFLNWRPLPFSTPSPIRGGPTFFPSTCYLRFSSSGLIISPGENRLGPFSFLRDFFSSGRSGLCHFLSQRLRFLRLCMRLLFRPLPFVFFFLHHFSANVNRSEFSSLVSIRSMNRVAFIVTFLYV